MQNRTPPPDYTLNCNPIPMVNTTSDTIPPGGILANVGNPDDEGRKRVGKPTANGETGCYVSCPYSVQPPDTAKGIVGAGWCSYASPIRAAYNPADGTPAIGETWGPVAGSFLLGKNKPGFKIDGEASPDEGTVPVVRVDGTIIEDEYPYSYGGSGGSSVSFSTIVNLYCDAASGNTIYDTVEFTIIALMRGGRTFLSISAEVVSEDDIAVETECKEFLTPATTVACVDGDIVFTKVSEIVRVVVCGSCS